MNQHACNQQAGGSAHCTITTTPSDRVNIEDLWARYIKNKNDTQLEHELILHYLPLVKHVIGRLTINLPPHIDMSDIESAGIMGLIQAIRSYDPTTRTPFEKFAPWRIKGAIIDELRKNGWIPRSTHDKAKQIQEAINTLYQTNGRAPTENEVANQLGITTEEYNNWLDYTKPRKMVSLDAPLESDEPNGHNLQDILHDPNQETPFEQVCKQDLIEVLERELDNMPKIQQRVLVLYYIYDLQLKEIGKLLGLTESRICQIHTAALQKLKKAISQKLQFAHS